MTPTIRRRFPLIRAILSEIRATLRDVARFLYLGAVGLLAMFVAGAFVGAFVAGCDTVASLAPSSLDGATGVTSLTPAELRVLEAMRTAP